MNNSETFKESVSIIIRELSLIYPSNVEIGISDTTFYRIIMKENKTVLKCDFVNDSTCYYGENESSVFFSKIDNPYNILSNKISALPRSEPKDVADILFLSYKYNFNWSTIIEQAQSKDLWVNPIDVSSLIETFPINLFDAINWINKPDYLAAQKHLKQIAKDILLGVDNSLVG